MQFLENRLLRSKLQGTFRQLRLIQGKIDFSSNDYLGFARSSRLFQLTSTLSDSQKLLGSTGSRLLNGNSNLAEYAEKLIAEFHGDEAALLFNSGYDANLSLFSSVPSKSDTVIFDELVHASIRDGIRLSPAKSFSFKHNDIDDLRRKIQHANGNIFIAVESVYSMDGNFAPITDLIELKTNCKSVNLIIDEAHAGGIFGDSGQGLISGNDSLYFFARVYTYGKAFGVHGASVVGSELLKSYLINFARPFIYTTALPAHSYASIISSYQLIPEANENRRLLFENIRFFKEQPLKNFHLLNSDSPIQSIIIPGNEKVRSVAAILQDAGYDVRPIVSPSVPKGLERLRICIHSFNTKEEIIVLIKILNS